MNRTMFDQVIGLLLKVNIRIHKTQLELENIEGDLNDLIIKLEQEYAQEFD